MISQAQSSALSFIQKRRKKVAEMHRNLREQILNKSRQILQDHLGTNKSCTQNEQQQNQNQSQQREDSQQFLSQQIKEEIMVQFNENSINHAMMSMDIKQQDRQQSLANNIPKLDSQKQLKRSHANKNKKKQVKYSQLFQIASWMINIPEQISNFYVVARGSGKHCILVFEKSTMTIYDKFNRKQSVKIQQDGWAQIKKLSQHFSGTILQITFIQAQYQTCLITDVIKWKNNYMSSQNFQFRISWIAANSHLLLSNKIKGLKFMLAQYLPLQNSKNLVKAYHQNFGYEKQGLLFVHKQSPYVHGFNQNVMIWKDNFTSKYPIDTLIQGENIQNEVEQVKNKNYIYGTGKLQKNNQIYSLDGYKLGEIKYINSFIPKSGFIKYRISGIQFDSITNDKNQMQDQTSFKNQTFSKIVLKDFQAIQYRKYGQSEPLSRIIFQHRMRHDPLNFEQIFKQLTKQTPVATDY